jgi:8-oxo-dGTP pyrophosphatase MutT (NUDIX family)
MTERGSGSEVGSPARSGDPRLDRVTPLHPGTGSAALIIVAGEYLLQLRDNKHGIFFPGHWGCFGGACDPGESPEQTLVRELSEELGLEHDASRVRYFTVLEFDLAFAGLAPIRRYFYEVAIDPAVYAKLRLEEGAAMRLFGPEAVLTGSMPVTPYDGFALWLHINAKRLR